MYKILDFDSQIKRLFSYHVEYYDNRETAVGQYDIIFTHREGISDNFDEICKYSNENTKIVVDITTESGNIQQFLDMFEILCNSHPYDFILIVDSDLSDYKKQKNNIKFQIVDDYSLLFYAFTNPNSDSYMWYDVDGKYKGKKKYMSLNGSLRESRLLLLLEFEKRKISIEGMISFLLYSNIDGNRVFSKERYDEMANDLFSRNLINQDDLQILKGMRLPIECDIIMQEESDTHFHIANTVDGRYDAVVNIVTENTHGLSKYNDLPNYDIVTFTEKTLKPFLAGQIPLIFGPPNLQRELRKLGFDLFDDIVDTNFETIKEPAERLKTMMDSFENLVKIDLEKYRKDNISRFIKNRLLVVQLSNKGYEKITEFIYSLLNL